MTSGGSSPADHLFFVNPVYPLYFADPFAWQHEGVYYAIGTGEGSPDAGLFQILTSPDLRTWTPVAKALAPLAPEYGDNYWAPEIGYQDGTFYLYYSVGRGDKSHHIRVAVSRTPEGPYEDTGERITNPFYCPFAIDASPFRDDDGQWYLFYARDFLDQENGARVGTGVVVDRLATMTALAGDERTVVRPTHEWQRFLSHRIMYGGIYDWHTVEGPFVRKHQGRYYCFFSGGRWECDTYGVDYVVADHVLGPYTSEASEAPRVLRTVPGKLIGPGHNSIVLGPDGADHIVYHAWDAQMSARRMFIETLIWTPSGPRVQSR